MFLQKKRLKRNIFNFNMSLLSSCILLSNISVYSAVEQSETQKSNPISAEFNPDFLYGKSREIDLSVFKYDNPVIAGEYNLDVYINDRWHDRKKMTFKSTQKNKNATLCFSRIQLLEYGVKEAYLLKKQPLTDLDCQPIEVWLESAFYQLDANSLRLDLSIPQIAMKNNPRDFVDQALWDRGIDAAYLAYSGGAYKIFNQSQVQLNSSHLFMGINSGLNIAGWQLKHQGQWNWSELQKTDQKKSQYYAINTYLQRAFAQYRAVLSLGDYYSSGYIFDSVGYRGVDFSSDERMLPSSLLGYAPQIRGMAKTNAKIEIWQKGQLIYQTSVSPGRFEINDLYPTGYAGELEVRVLETHGEIQSFIVPYAAVVQMLRPGLARYSVTLGQLKDHNIVAKPWFTQVKYMRGLNNDLTGYSGIQWSEHYRAFSLGAALATPIGAVAMDVSHSSAAYFKASTESGQSYRLSYSKLMIPSATHLNLAVYRYSTASYSNFRNATQMYELDKNGISTANIARPRNEFQITLNQSLASRWGSLYLVAALVDYWSKAEKSKFYNIGYTNHYKSFNYSISALKRRLSFLDQHSREDTEYFLNVSFPWDFGKRNTSVSSSISKSQHMLSMTGRHNEVFDYSSSIQHQHGSHPSFNLNGQYHANFINIGAGINLADHHQQAHVNFQGNVVAHAGGVVFGAGDAQTMALVYAPDAVGAKVNNIYGLKVNRAGYAVIPYMTPYRMNHIELDPSEMSLNVELEESSQRVAPYAGAILKVDFATKLGYAIFIKSRLASGEALPFYAPVYNAENELIAHVAQGSLVYIRSKQTVGRLKVQLNEAKQQQCFIDFNVSTQMHAVDNKVFMTEAVCQ